MKYKKGFTLGELLIVLGIISVLLSTILVGSLNIFKRARDTQRMVDMQNIRTALEMFYQTNGHFPGSAESISGTGEYIGVNPPSNIDIALAPFMDKVPKDPQHNPINGYYYAYDPSHCIKASGSCNCSGPGSSPYGVLFGFHKSEALTNLRKDSICGGDMNLDTASYNIALFPPAP